VLENSGLIDADRRWSGGSATLAVVGDLVDRGPDGIGVIDLLMRLQSEAPASGGCVRVLIGNHDIQLLAAQRFGDGALAYWQAVGGVLSDLERLTDQHIAWLQDLPAMCMEADAILVHADAMFYLELGSTVEVVNTTFRSILHGHHHEDWQHLLDQFTEHRCFSGPEGEANINQFLGTYAAQRVAHGHTPIARMLQLSPETVTAAYVYRDGRAINVDPGIYLGGPGFSYRLA
jgi:hypothetical protein